MTVKASPDFRPESGVEPTKRAETSAYRLKLTVAERALQREVLATRRVRQDKLAKDRRCKSSTK